MPGHSGADTARARDDRDHAHIRLLLSFLLDRDANCIDVGAYHGLVLAEIVRVAPQGRHMAYEPLDDHAAALRERFPDVDVRARGLSDRSGSVQFYRVRDEPALSGLHPRDAAPQELESSEVGVETLDEALPAGYVPSLIKIDVEGAEELVLKGAKRTLAEHRPVVILEHGAGAKFYGTPTARIFTLLRDAGLRIFDIDGAGPYDQQSMEAVIATDRLWTWVAHR